MNKEDTDLMDMPGNESPHASREDVVPQGLSSDQYEHTKNKARLKCSLTDLAGGYLVSSVISLGKEFSISREENIQALKDEDGQDLYNLVEIIYNIQYTGSPNPEVITDFCPIVYQGQSNIDVVSVWLRMPHMVMPNRPKLVLVKHHSPTTLTEKYQ